MGEGFESTVCLLQIHNALFLRRHYPDQVCGSQVYLPLSRSHRLPGYETKTGDNLS